MIATLAQVQFPSSTIMVFEFAANSGGGAAGNEQGHGSAFTIVRRSNVTPGTCNAYNPANTTNNLTNFFGTLMPAQQTNERAIPSSERHAGGANYAFRDGHAKWYKPERIEGQCNWGNGNQGIEFGNDGRNPDFRL